jgi:hypothetical protein
VAQLHLQALGTHFSRLLRHAWVTVGLFFNPSFKTTKQVILSEISGSRGSEYKLYSLLECELHVILKCSENEVSSHFHSLLINFIHSTFQTIAWVNKQEMYQEHWSETSKIEMKKWRSRKLSVSPILAVYLLTGYELPINYIKSLTQKKTLHGLQLLS